MYKNNSQRNAHLQRLFEDDTIFLQLVDHLRMYSRTVPVGAGAVFIMFLVYLEVSATDLMLYQIRTPERDDYDQK